MIFATCRTPHTAPRPALVSNDRIYPLPLADMHAVIALGADKAASLASQESFAPAEVQFLAP
ncbi:MAG TPA: hypothetical protein PKN81_19485, partial [Anaerolineales bacterium]|nr:hypothetical protein [Anaerolineales bacterium]